MKRPLVLLVTVILACLGSVAPVASAAGERAAFAKVSDWGSGWEGRFTVTNGGTTAIGGWRGGVDPPAGPSMGSYWGAPPTPRGTHPTFTHPGDKGSLAPRPEPPLR